MDTLNGPLSKLNRVKGLGEARMASLLSKLGGDGLVEALSEGDVLSITSVGSFPERLAVDMVLAFRGEDPSRLLTTEAATELMAGIQEALASYMHTDHARNQVSLMVPGGRWTDSEARARERSSYAGLVEGRDRRAIDRLLSAFSSRPKDRPRPSLEEHTLLAENWTVRSHLERTGIDKVSRVLIPEELTEGEQDGLVLVYDERALDEERLPIIASVHYRAPVHEIAPGIVLRGSLPSVEHLEALSGLEMAFGRPGRASEAATTMDGLVSPRSGSLDEEGTLSILERVRMEVQSSMEARISALSFSGEEALTLLLKEEPSSLKEIYRDHARMASELVKERLGVRKDLIDVSYPPKVDREALGSMLAANRWQAAASRFSFRVSKASALVSMESSLKEEMRWGADLDLRWGIGCFVSDHGLHPFSSAEDIFLIEGAAHLDLRRSGDYQCVDYSLGGEGCHRTALLTGANSGGKTTLLETIAQTVILASMGMPVPAERALVPPIDRLLVYRPKRRLDAGGLESFLRDLLPISLDVDGRTMVLADELEAMTELDAAARIIGVFLDELVARKAYGVVVTHLADEVLRYTSCRVDGIEAKGLDGNNELIVDRTPHIGRRARSTPELILRKLEASSGDREKTVYRKVLSRFA